MSNLAENLWAVTTGEKLERFRSLVESEYTAGLERDHPGWTFGGKAVLKVGAKYARVDVGYGEWMSGKYMVDLATGDIFGIKGYGVIHRGHQYGTLDTIEAWNWSGYTAVRRTG